MQDYREGGFEKPQVEKENLPDITLMWPSFIEQLLLDKPKLGSLLSQAKLAGFSSGFIELRFSPSFKFQFQELNKKPNRDEICRRLRSFMNLPTIDLRMTLETDSPDDNDLKYFPSKAGFERSINYETEKEPIIKAVLEIFDGEVIE